MPQERRNKKKVKQRPDKKRQQIERKLKDQPSGNFFQNKIDVMKTVYSAGYESMKNDPNRPPTPVPFSQDFKEKHLEWREKILEHLYLEDTEISVEDSKNMIKDIKGKYPYDFYDRFAPRDNEYVRKVKTPEPTETLRGDEWKEMSENWLSDLRNYVSSPDFKQYSQAVKEAHDERDRDSVESDDPELEMRKAEKAKLKRQKKFEERQGKRAKLLEEKK